jgi:ferric-dicitrate binding protein FerR (iron transport regulator)
VKGGGPGERFKWNIVVKDKVEIANDKEGRQISVEGETSVEDGTITLYPTAFSSPGVLASTILHERVHFYQFSEGWGNRMTKDEYELEAWMTEFYNAKATGLSHAELQRVKEAIVTIQLRSGPYIPNVNRTALLGGAVFTPIPGTAGKTNRRSSPVSEKRTPSPQRSASEKASPSLPPCHAPSRPGPRIDMRSLTPNPLTRLNQVRSQNRAQESQRDLQAEANKMAAPYLARTQSLHNLVRSCSGKGCSDAAFNMGMGIQRDVMTKLLPQLQGLTDSAAPSLAPSIDETFARMRPRKAAGKPAAGRDYPTLCRKFELIKTFAEPARESFPGLPVEQKAVDDAARDYQAKLAALAPPPPPDGGIAAAAAPIAGALYRETPAGSVKTDAARLGLGDTLRTGPNGKADVNLSNGHSLRLEAGTTLSLGQDESGRALYDVKGGRIRSTINCAAGGEACARQRVFRPVAGSRQVPVAVASVRGTELELSAPPEGPVELVVRKGLVAFRGGAGEAVSVGAGMRSTLDGAGKASQPEAVDAAALENWFSQSNPPNEKKLRKARKRLDKARAQLAKAAAKEDEKLRKAYAKESAPWTLRLGKEACLGSDCFAVQKDPAGWGRACGPSGCFDPRRLRPKEEELWLDAPLTKFQTATGGVILEEVEVDAQAKETLAALTALNQDIPPAEPAPHDLLALSLPEKRLLARKLRAELAQESAGNNTAPFAPDPAAREAFRGSPRAFAAYTGLGRTGPQARVIAAVRLAKELFGDGSDWPAAAAKLAGREGRAAAADIWVDAFTAAGLTRDAALAHAYAAWSRLP